MRETVYTCDRCGEQMKDPYVTIEPKVNSNVIHVPEEYHYCVNCGSYVKENLRSDGVTKAWIKNMRRGPGKVTCESKDEYSVIVEWTDKDNLSSKGTWTKDSIH